MPTRVRTNMNLDQALVRKAMRRAGVPTMTAAVHAALREFVAARERKDLREIAGKVKFARGYDHKRARRAK